MRLLSADITEGGPKRSLGTEALSRAEPEVRIHFPPGKSRLQTRSPFAPSGNPRFVRTPAWWRAFFRQAIKNQQRCPQTITLDGYAASHRAVRELKAAGSLPANTKLRSSKYLNNVIEQDHRGVKQRIAVMLGFKGFSNAAITITGIELLHRIRKGQFKLRGLGVQDQAAPAVWNAVLRA